MSDLPNKKYYEEKEDYNQSNVEFENESFHDQTKCRIAWNVFGKINTGGLALLQLTLCKAQFFRISLLFYCRRHVIQHIFLTFIYVSSNWQINVILPNVQRDQISNSKSSSQLATKSPHKTPADCCLTRFLLHAFDVDYDSVDVD